MSKEQIVTHLADLSKQSIKRGSRSLFASDLDTLASLLLEELFYESDPSLLRKIVIYPTNDIKDFIIQEIVKTKASLFGLRFLSLPQAIEHFIKLTSLHPPTFPTHIPLTLHIEQEIRALLSSPTVEILPLLEYLSGDEKKLLHLSEKLGSIFLHYGLYGSSALIDWERQKGWQQLLWERLKRRWDFPCNLLSAPLTPPFPMEVHLFHITHIPKLYRTYFDHLEKHLSISTYFLTPSPLYWGDLLGDKTLARLDQSFERKGVKIEERAAFSSFSNDVNPFMQNLSSLAQPVFDWLSEKESIEAFTPPIGLTLLSSMKVALYDLSPFEKESGLKDDSLQIHEAPSKLREVEILLENLKALYQKEPFSFSDLLVLAPNMELYHPYIKLLFTNDSLFGSAFHSSQNKDPLPLFFDFIDSRFEPELLFTLLSFPMFKQKTFFSEEEIEFFQSLVEEKGIDWGFNLEMRQEILEENDLSSRGSWAFAFDTIIHSIPFSSCEVEISKLELLGEWITFIQKLYKDLSTFKKGSHSITEWIEITTTLLDTYFDRCEETDSLKKELKKLFEVGSFVKEEFLYPSIRQAIDSYFKEKKETLSSPIRFSSITDPAIPSVKILCVLGLDEESFPRRSSHSSLNALKKTKGADHQPEIGEKDRYFFLQTILSAKKHLIFSFVNKSAVDGKELYPSPLLKELPTTITSHLPFPYYKKEATLPHFSPVPQKKPTEVSCKSLLRLMKHPLQFYANECLGIYFESREEKVEKKNSEFFLSYQDRAILTSRHLQKDSKDIFEEIEQNNLLPTALFKEVAARELQERLIEMNTHYQTLGIDKGEIFSLLLHPAAEKLSFIHKEIATAPTIPIPLSDHESILLYGKIDFLTPHGALINGEDSFEELWKALPTLFLMAHLFKNIPPTLLFAKSGTKKTFSIQDPLQGLASLVKYYLAAIKSPSPLMPNRVEPLLEGNREKFHLLAQKKDSFFQDPYLEKIEPNLSFPWEDHLPIIPPQTY